MNIKSLYILFFLLLTHWGQAQSGTNYPTFDRKKFHFGFALSINTADFHYNYQLDSTNTDSIVNINIKKQGGFNLGIVSSWDVNQNIHFRFIPSISFQERLFTYQYLEDGELESRDTRLESTTLDFPIIFKLRTKRINNFAAYGLTGAQYSLDLASQADTKIEASNPTMKMQKHDFSYQVGGGFDFFLEYFKFGIELKLNNGIKNVLIQDHTFYNNPLTSLKTKVWVLSLTFEG